MPPRSVAITVLALMAASMAPVTRAMAAPAASQIRQTPVSCVFTLPLLGLEADTTRDLTGARRANECDQGPLAVSIPAVARTVSVAPAAMAPPPIAVPVRTAEEPAPGRGTSVAVAIVEEAEPDLAPGGIKPSPPSPMR